MRKIIKIFKRFSPILIVLFITLFLVIVKFPRESGIISYRFYQILVSPVSRLSKSVSDSLVHTWDAYFTLAKTHEENLILIDELKKYKGMETELRELRKTLERLRGVLKLQPKLPFKLKVAEVVALDMSLERQAFWVNAGTRDGVFEAQPVIDHSGVIGQVFKTFPNRSLVLTLNDPLFDLHVMNVRTNERGVVTGEKKQGMLLLRYSHRESEVKEGDLIVTSGLGDVFPYGIGVGHVALIEKPKTALENQVWLKPLVDIEKVQEVFVILAKQAKKVP